ncbi:hypothetical protein [Thermicanus aegyptius]|uniref:hypothetical protein n=1 Tax=Thermicanus aegyptius TaxID=94009 RepID=UPI000405C539|nr:hypothetical protein [Thermicanus aegyptius]
MNTTQNIGLKKPEQTDFYNIDDFNFNADKIDEEIAKRMFNAGGVPSAQAGTDASKPAPGTVGRLYIANDTGRIYIDTGTAWALIATVNWNDIAGKPTSFTPSAHASSHASSGSDPISPADIGAETPSGAQAKVDAHANRTDNPHAVTAAQVGALASVDGVSNPGGNIDLIAGANIAITPDNTNKRVTIAGTGTWPQATNADTVDGQHGAYYLSRANHTGTQAPNTIAPQGVGSGLDADMVDGKHLSAIGMTHNGTLYRTPTNYSTSYATTSTYIMVKDILLPQDLYTIPDYAKNNSMVGECNITTVKHLIISGDGATPVYGKVGYIANGGAEVFLPERTTTSSAGLLTTETLNINVSGNVRVRHWVRSNGQTSVGYNYFEINGSIQTKVI